MVFYLLFVSYGSRRECSAIEWRWTWRENEFYVAFGISCVKRGKKTVPSPPRASRKMCCWLFVFLSVSTLIFSTVDGRTVVAIVALSARIGASAERLLRGGWFAVAVSWTHTYTAPPKNDRNAGWSNRFVTKSTHFVRGYRLTPVISSKWTWRERLIEHSHQLARSHGKFATFGFTIHFYLNGVRNTHRYQCLISKPIHILDPYHELSKATQSHTVANIRTPIHSVPV